MTTSTVYPARLEIDYPTERNRLRTLFRIVLVIPALLPPLRKGRG